MLISDYKWLFLDLGGTLVDETGIENDRAMQIQAIARASGIAVSTDEIKRFVGQSAAALERDIIGHAIARIIGDAAEAAALSRTIGYFHEYEAPYPGAAQVLAQLSRKYKIGIVANQKIGTEDRLKKYGLHEYAAFVVSSAEAGLHKPDPAIFLLALEKAGCEPWEAVMVGDRLDNDIRPAKALGMGTVWVRQGYHGLAEPREEAEQPDLTIESIDELPGVLIR